MGLDRVRTHNQSLTVAAMQIGDVAVMARRHAPEICGFGRVDRHPLHVEPEGVGLDFNLLVLIVGYCPFGRALTRVVRVQGIRLPGPGRASPARR